SHARSRRSRARGRGGIPMRCADLMKHDVESCWSEDPVCDVAARMRARNVGFLPVVDDDGTVIGTITDRDLAIRVLADDLPSYVPVGRVMSRGVVMCAPEASLREAEELMRRNRKSRIVCVDQHGRPVGVISLSDVVGAETSGRAAR